MRAVGLGHVFEADVHVPFAANDEVRDFVYILKFVEGSDDVLGLTFPEPASGKIDVFLG